MGFLLPDSLQLEKCRASTARAARPQIPIRLHPGHRSSGAMGMMSTSESDHGLASSR